MFDVKPENIIPYSSIYIDMQYSYLVKTLLQFILPSDREALIDIISEKFLNDQKNDRLIVTPAVRTAFDAILTVLNFEPGSEMIVTSINIPDMISIIRHHSIVPVPVEIDPETLAPSLEEIKQAYNKKKTKGILLAYLYGSRYESSKLIDWAKEQGLYVFEDEAESFNNTERNGSQNADFSFFSFGTIKSLSAFGGSLCVMRKNEGLYLKVK